MISPSNGAITDDRTVSLDWSDATDPGGIDEYQVQVDNNSNFSSPEFDEKPTSSSDTTTSLPDNLYYWHVRAKDGANNWGGWSSPWTFRVDDTDPPMPWGLTNPENPTDDATPNVTWSGADNSGGSGLDHYLIGWDSPGGDTAADFYLESTDTTLSNSDWNKEKLDEEGVWNWWVQAIDRAGNESPWAPDYWDGKDLEYRLPTVSLPDASVTYTDDGDTDGDTFYSILPVNIYLSTDFGSRDVYAKLTRDSGLGESLIDTSDDFTVTTTATWYSPFDPILGLSHDTYDLNVYVYDADTDEELASIGDWTDGDLNDVAIEQFSQEILPPPPPTNVRIDSDSDEDTGASQSDGITKETTPLFVWTAPDVPSGTNEYEYEYHVKDGSGSWEDLGIWETNSSDAEWEAWLAFDDGEYRIRFRAIEDTENVVGQWSNWCYFEIDTEAPLPFDPFAPSGVIDTLTPTISWSVPAGVWKTDVKVDEWWNGVWLEEWTESNILDSSIGIPKDELSWDGWEYLAKLRAYDTAGNASDWSEGIWFQTATFTVIDSEILTDGGGDTENDGYLSSFDLRWKSSISGGSTQVMVEVWADSWEVGVNDKKIVEQSYTITTDGSSWRTISDIYVSNIGLDRRTYDLYLVLKKDGVTVEEYGVWFGHNDDPDLDDVALEPGGDGTDLSPGKWTAIIHGLVPVEKTYAMLTRVDDFVDYAVNWMWGLGEKLMQESENVAVHKMNVLSTSLTDIISTGYTRDDSGVLVEVGIDDATYHHALLVNWAEVSNYILSTGKITTYANWIYDQLEALFPDVIVSSIFSEEQIAESLEKLVEVPPNGASGEDGYAEAAGDFVYALTKATGIAPLVQTIIGHSRGAIVASELAQRLLRDGDLAECSLDHVIYLDAEGGRFGFTGDPLYSDYNYHAWEGVRTDNYWQYYELLVEPGGLEGKLNILGPSTQTLHENTDTQSGGDNNGYLRGGRNFDADRRGVSAGEDYNHSIFPEYLIGNTRDGFSGLYIVDGSLETQGVPDSINYGEQRATTYGAPDSMQLFNGSFDGELQDSTAGWWYHGGGYDLASAGGGVVEDGHLILGNGDSRTHNWAYVPGDVKSLVFSCRIENIDAAPAQLNIYWAGQDGVFDDSQAFGTVPITVETTGWTPFIFDLPEGVADSVGKVKFMVEGDDPVEVWLDNISWSDQFAPAPEIDVEYDGQDDVHSRDFGNVLVGESRSVTLTIHNEGDAILVVEQAVGLNASFVLEPANGDGSDDDWTIAEGATKEFVVAFWPTAAVSYSATLTLLNTDKDEGSYRITLTGSGTEPDIDVELPGQPDNVHSFNFGDVRVGQSASQTFTVRNEGQAPLVVTQVSDLDTPYSITPANEEESHDDWTVAAGGTAEFAITFSPNVATSYPAQLTLISNDSDEGSYIISLSGTGTTPDIDVELPGQPDDVHAYDYGIEGVGTTTSQEFTIRNEGTSELRVMEASGLSGTAFSVNPINGSDSSDDWIVARDETRTFLIEFTPPSFGPYYATLVLSNDDLDEGDYLISLTGNGVAAGVRITESEDSTDVSESGQTDTYDVVLMYAPTAEVTVDLHPDGQVTVVPQALTFTTSNWDNPQTVTVTAVDDHVAEGIHFGTVMHTLTSEDENYAEISVDAVVARITDNEVAGVSVVENAGETEVEEAGTGDDYSLVLTSQPLYDVVITVVPGDGLAVFPQSVPFTPTNWNIPQGVDVSAIDDYVAQGDRFSSITHAATSEDGNYDGDSIDIDDVAVRIVDDDEAGIEVVPYSGLITYENGSSTQFTVVLTSEPIATVTISLSSLDISEGTVSPEELVFDPDEWDKYQTVTVTGVDDDVIDGDIEFLVELVVSDVANEDPVYAALGVQTVSVMNRDDDGRGEIHGTVWNDWDGNGERAAEEPGLEGRVIYLDENENGKWDASDPGFSCVIDPFCSEGPIDDPNDVATVTDGTTGTTAISTSPAWGNFPISEMVFGWMDGELPVATWANGMSILRVEFNQMVSEVSLAFHSQRLLADAPGWLRAFDNNGHLVAEAETTVSESFETLTISLTDNEIAHIEASGMSLASPVMLDCLAFSRTAIDAELSAITGENGEYSFADLLPGTYRVAAVVPEWWEQTFPKETSYHSIVVESGDLIAGVDFGNQEPPVVDAGANTTVDEGETFTRTGFFVDERGSSWRAIADYGDGHVEQLAVDTATKAFELDHIFGDNGQYTVTVTVTDPDRGAVGKDRFTITVNNVDPSLWVRGMRTIDEGQQLNIVDIGMFTDPGFYDLLLENNKSYDYRIDWVDGTDPDTGVADIDIPGGPGRLTRGTFDGKHTYLDNPSDNEPYRVALAIKDDDGEWEEDRFRYMSVRVKNVAPTILDVNIINSTVQEGDEATIGVAFSDPGLGDSHTALIDWGDGTLPESVPVSEGAREVSASHVYADDDPTGQDFGVYTIMVTVTDDDGDSSDPVFEDITVHNADPTVTAAITPSASEGQTITLTVGISDPGVNDVFRVEVDWGDGTQEPVLPPSKEADRTFTHIYADNGVFPVTVRVTDDDTGSDMTVVSTTILNQSPAIQTVTFTEPAYEGIPVSFEAVLKDLGTLDTHVAEIDWGDGTPLQTLTVAETPFGPPGDVNGITGVIQGSHTYPDNGVYDVVLRIRDDDMLVETWVTHEVSLTAENKDPVIDTLDDRTIVEGEELSLSVTFEDLAYDNPPSTAETFEYQVNWGDGSHSDWTDVTKVVSGGPGVPTQGSFDVNHVYADNGQYTVTVTVVDDDEGEDSETFQATVNNVAPTLTLDLPSELTINEGTELSLPELASFTDPAFVDALLGNAKWFDYEIRWGDGHADTDRVTDVTNGGNGVPTRGRFGGSHTYADDGDYWVTVVVRDDDGDEDSETFQVEVKNVAPDVWLAGTQWTAAGVLLEIEDVAVFWDPAFYDPVLDNDKTFTYRIDWDDGSPADEGTVVDIINGKPDSSTFGSLDASHTYMTDGSYFVTVTIDDGDGGVTPEMFEVVVGNSLEVELGPDASAQEGVLFTKSVSFADPAGSHWTGTVNYGDGSSPEPLDLDARTFVLNHYYPDNRSYPIAVSIENNLGMTASDSVWIDVVNNDPTFDPWTGPSVISFGATYAFSIDFEDPGFDNPDGTPPTSEFFTYELLVRFQDFAGGQTEFYHFAGPVTLVTPGSPGIPTRGTISTGFVVEDPGTSVSQMSITVTVYDDDGGSDSLTKTISVDTFTVLATEEEDSPNESYTYSGIGPATYEEYMAKRIGRKTSNSMYAASLNSASAEADQKTFIGPLINLQYYAAAAPTAMAAESTTQAPSLTVVGNLTRDEGFVDFGKIGAFLDSDSYGPFVYEINWGDGTANSVGVADVDELMWPPTVGSIDCNHEYADDGFYIVEVTLTDEQGNPATESFELTIVNVPPKVDLVYEPDSPLEGSEVTVTAIVDDPGTADTHLFRWNDGDETPVPTYKFIPEDGVETYTVSVSVADDDEPAKPADATITITVDNVPPTIALDGADETQEGDVYTLTLGTIIDPGTDTVTRALIDWGDGSSPEELDPLSALPVEVTHVYLDDDPTETAEDDYTISVNLVDEDGTHDEAGEKNIVVSNIEPQAINVMTVSPINEGEETTLSGGILDPGSADSFTLVVNWGDGSSAESYSYPAGTTGFEETHTYGDTLPNNEPYTIELTLTDDDSGSDSANASVTVNDVAPVIDLVGADSTSEGAPYLLTLGEITDPGEDTVTKWIVHWGDGTENTYDSGGEKDHTYKDDNPTGTTNDPYLLTVDLIDEEGLHPQVGAKGITVHNVAPTLGELSITPVGEGELATLKGEVFDPGVEDSFVLHIVWGDGQDSEYGVPASSRAFAYTHSYVDNLPGDSPYLIAITVTDDDTQRAETVLPASVSNLPPVAVDDYYVFDGVGTLQIDATRGVLANDRDPGNDLLVVDSWGTPTVGELVETNADGWFKFDAPDDYSGTATFTYFVRDDDGAVSQHEAVVLIDVGMNASITGYVYAKNEADRFSPALLPLPGVMVTLIAIDNTELRGPVEINTITDDDGRYQFNGLRSGDYRVEARQPAGCYENGSLETTVVLGANDAAVAEDLLTGWLRPECITIGSFLGSTIGKAPAYGWSVGLRARLAEAERRAGNIEDAYWMQLGEVVQTARRGSEVTITGTSLDEAFEFTSDGTDYHLTLGDRIWSLPIAEIRRVRIRSGGGEDSAILHDTVLDDFLDARYDSIALSNDRFECELRDFSWVRAISESGGTDRKSVDSTVDFLLEILGDWQGE